MICIQKRAISFHPLISIKANGITFHYNGQPRTVSRKNLRHRGKKKKLTLSDQTILWFKLEGLYSVK